MNPELLEREIHLQLQGLPNEMLLAIFLRLSLTAIGRLSQTSTFFALVCSDESFWKVRAIQDRPELIAITPVSGWKNLYRQSFHAWGAGDFGLQDYLYRVRPMKFNGSVPFKQLAVGSEYILGLDLDGRIRVFGNNLYRQLGTGDQRTRDKFTRIRHRAKSIYAGNRQTLFIDLEDFVWVVGTNVYGQLGLGHTEEVKQLTRLDFKAKKIAVGTNHTLFIDLESNVWACGSNFYGQLGLGDQDRRTRPTSIPGIRAKEIAVGESFSVLIDLEDRVWVSGWNKRGQLGLPLARYGPLDPEQRIELIPVQIPQIKAKRVVAGGDFLLIADLENRLWACGWNYLGQLGLGHERTVYQLTLVSETLRVKEMAAGLCHSIVLDMENNVWSFGGNYFGQLGLGHTNHQNRPTRVPGLKAKSILAGPALTGLIVLSYQSPFRRN